MRRSCGRPAGASPAFSTLCLVADLLRWTLHHTTCRNPRRFTVAVEEGGGGGGGGAGLAGQPIGLRSVTAVPAPHPSRRPARRRHGAGFVCVLYPEEKEGNLAGRGGGADPREEQGEGEKAPADSPPPAGARQRGFCAGARVGQSMTLSVSHRLNSRCGQHLWRRLGCPPPLQKEKKRTRDSRRRLSRERRCKAVCGGFFEFYGGNLPSTQALSSTAIGCHAFSCSSAKQAPAHSLSSNHRDQSKPATGKQPVGLAAPPPFLGVAFTRIAPRSFLVVVPTDAEVGGGRPPPPNQQSSRCRVQ